MQSPFFEIKDFAEGRAAQNCCFLVLPNPCAAGYLGAYKVGGWPLCRRNSASSAVLGFGLWSDCKTPMRGGRLGINVNSTIAAAREPVPQAMSQPRAIGAGRLSVCADDAGVTRLKDLRQSGSMRLVFPQTYAPHAEVVIVNTAGGITGGDRFSLDVEVQAGAQLNLTTQAAERAYRAQPSEVGEVANTLLVRDGGRLNWLPQELILFDRSALRRRLDVTLEGDARLLMVEPVVFGRAAMPEVLRDVMFRDRIAIHRDARPIYLDGLDLSADATAHLARSCIANGAGAMASVVLAAPEAQSHLSAVRALLPPTAGASLLARDVLVVRLLARDSFELRRSLVPLLEQLLTTDLPTSWRL